MVPPNIKRSAIEMAGKYSRIARDLELFSQGISPSSAEISKAPLLNSYRITRREYDILAGKSYGHPLIEDGPIFTSQLIIFNREDGWARTLSRYYRLGEPAEPNQATSRP
ncbi:DUF6634 family protein [Nitrospirillum sp. BR 11163]|uniref:DUF6634 family protein n=2 Tax=Nitrospirillum TaxID=1543705 RepID=UPI002AFFBD9E|nr:DUF6634 family protein [Nitrospirillum sp. BR 11163]MEA1673988.1 DUF6634 family protein [Nitrospirillum sp. BR 11163]